MSIKVGYKNSSITLLKNLFFIYVYMKYIQFNNL